MKIVVAGIIRDRFSLILLVRRGPEQSLGGYWEFPGGKLEVGETEQECLERELNEKLSIDVKVGQYVAKNDQNDIQGQFVLKAIEAVIERGEIILTVHDRLVWVEAANLLAYGLAPADIQIAEFLIIGN